MKACYGELKVPNVPKSHSWTPDKVKSLSHAGDLYVRAFKPLVIDVHNENTSNTQWKHTTRASTPPIHVILWAMTCGGPTSCWCWCWCVCVCVCVCVKNKVYEKEKGVGSDVVPLFPGWRLCLLSCHNLCGHPFVPHWLLHKLIHKVCSCACSTMLGGTNY